MMKYKESSYTTESSIECLCRFPETRRSTPRLLYRKVESVGRSPSEVNLAMLASEDSSELKEFGIGNIVTEDRNRRHVKTGNCVLNEHSDYIDNRSADEIKKEQEPYYENVPPKFFYAVKPNNPNKNNK